MGQMERIVKTQGVCGGNACVANTRIPVWTLQQLRRLGSTDQKLLEEFPSLSAEDLSAAWDYVNAHAQEIEQAIEQQAPTSRRQGRVTPIKAQPLLKQIAASIRSVTHKPITEG